ncbi:MAG TPA: hypothetical protein H9673_03390 [Candidatus Adamsella sp.]|nr:hypothetical protein [Candidatus Adamsella sp.]
MLPAAVEKEHNSFTAAKLFSQDSDNNQKISKKELRDYIFDLKINNQEVPEFLQKLQERFDDLDKDNDKELSISEADSLKYNRGMWTISETTVMPAQTSSASTGANSSTSSNNSSNKLSDLLKDGAEEAAKYAFEKLKDKVDIKDLISKVF